MKESYRIMRDMKVPKLLRDKTFQNYDVKFNNHSNEVKKIIQLTESRKWIVITGKTSGVGKTHLAVASMFNSWSRDTICLNPQRYLYLNVRLEGLKIDTAGYNLTEILEELEGKRCLLMNELGREPDRIIHILEALIDDLYEWDGQLIATSPLTSADFQARYCGSILDRIDERGEIIELKGKSYRQRKVK